MSIWTTKEIHNILLQLDEKKFPSKKYKFVKDGDGLKELGHGASAIVFEGARRTDEDKLCAIKVIGFGEQNFESQFFEETIEAQSVVGFYTNNIVDIYETEELWLHFDEKDQLVSVKKEAPENQEERVLKLQFIYMEKLEPVIQRDQWGNIHACVEALQKGEEKELLKLAKEIGQVLQLAHNKNVLHRDVKLENIFYSPQKKIYKLGDFGVAKKTKDGFANTVAYTKGYAAPEIRFGDVKDQYDCTADIYSFGMMLFVLANELRFPESKSYHQNSEIQYKPGYVLPQISRISDEFYQIIKKMCMYNPDERYQSMNEVMVDIETLVNGGQMGYRTKNLRSYYIIGMVFTVLGYVGITLCFDLQWTVDFTIWEQIFFALGILKMIRGDQKKSYGFINGLLFCLGIYLFIRNGISWYGVVLWIAMMGFSGRFTGFVSIPILAGNMIELIQAKTGSMQGDFIDYRWVAVILVSFGIFILWNYLIMLTEPFGNKELLVTKKYFSHIVILYYLLFAVIGFFVRSDYFVVNNKLNQVVYEIYAMGVDYFKIGIAGCVASVFWIIRERFLYKRQKDMMAE